MTLGEILIQARLELDDTETDYLWSDSELTGYVNEAVEQACRRSRLIIDASTPDICEIDVVANQSVYVLDSRIIGVREILLEGKADPLIPRTVGEMNECVSQWRTATGEPSAFIVDYETGKIKLYPNPIAVGQLKLRVVRLPIEPLVDDDEVPEIKTQYHMALIHWVKHRAYLKKDADTLDKQASNDALALFEREFGQPRNAYNVEFDLSHLPYDNLDGHF